MLLSIVAAPVIINGQTYGTLPIRADANPYGVVTYGIYDNISTSNQTFYSGNAFNMSQIIFKQTETNAVRGCVNITSISAYDPVLHSINYYGAAYISTLQLNVNLRAILENNTNYTYGLQNVIQFNTSNQSYSIASEIFWLNLFRNATYGEKLNGSTQSYVIWNHYTLPFLYCSEISLSNYHNHPKIEFSYSINNRNIVFNTTILNVTSNNSHLLITPFKATPIHTAYDLEFTFGGIDGDNTNFTSLDARNMWIFYEENGTFTPFPSIFTYGMDTLEGAYDLRVIPSNNYATVMVGQPDPYVNIALTGTGNKTEFFGNSSETINNTLPNTLNQFHSTNKLLGGWMLDILSAVAIVIILIMLWFYLKVFKKHEL
ncbi:thermopsin [Candidatus Marsarchaeota archaeon]|nr:thermopsin [Candidatus Marsarchaeota archaeon]